MTVKQTAQEQVAEQNIEQPEVAPQEAIAGSDRLTELLTRVPNLALIAVGFFAGSPLFETNVMGNRHS